jgi:hypothetical protein
MRKQDRINELADAELHYLPSVFDKALLGYVEQGAAGRRHVQSCYGYQAMKATLLKDFKLSNAQVYAKLKQILANSNDKMTATAPVILTKLKREPRWNIILANKFPTWEGRNKAILGLAMTGKGYSGVIYNKDTCAKLLQARQSTGSDSELADYAQALTYIDNHLTTADLGKHTPWLLTAVY